MAEASEEELMQRWNNELQRQNDLYQANQIEDNFVEITRLPKKIDARALTSMIATNTRIVPKAVEICFKGEALEVAALVEFSSPVDAYRAVDKLRSSSIGKYWRLKLMHNPKFNNPEKDLINRWLR